VLTTGAALLLRSFSLLSQVSPGFRSENIVTAKVILPPWDYPTVAKITSLQRELLERVRTLPGVRSASLTDYLPLTGLYWTGDFSFKGRPPGEYGVEFHKRIVGPDYFRTLGVPLKKGRFFTDADTRETQRVVLINETLARRYFPHEDPIGKQIVYGRDPGEDAVWQTIVGVVGDERLEGLDVEPRPEVFEPYTQSATRIARLVVRSSTDPAALFPAIQREVLTLDRNLPIYESQALEQVVSQAVARQRFLVLLMGIFAGLALVLAILGTFAMISYRVAQQTREIGIRMALGAARGQVLRMVIGRAMLLVLAGIGLGLWGAFALGRILSSLLFRVSATDPATFVAVVSSLLLVALLSSYIPAHRAARIDPVIALRQNP
jgi:putative ABC transport system permease protein